MGKRTSVYYAIQFVRFDAFRRQSKFVPAGDGYSLEWKAELLHKVNQ